MTREQKIVLNLVAHSLKLDSSELVLSEDDLNEADWRIVLREVVLQTVVLSTFDAVTVYADRISKEVYEKWKSIAFNSIKNNLVVAHSQSDLIKMLGGKYNYVILKGQAAAAYYPKSELRVLGDVDFLIDPKDQSKIDKLLTDSGYEKEGTDHPNHVVFKKEKAHLEMHFEVAGIPYKEKGKIIRDYLSGVFKTKKIESQDGEEFAVPSDASHGLIILLHMQHHMLGEGFGLRHLCDWAAYVNKTSQADFWEQELLPLLKRIGLYRYAQVMTKTCARFLKTACPNWTSEIEESVCDEIMNDILLGGNFGRKDRTRAVSGLLISERGKNGTKHGALYNLTHTLHAVVLRKFPIVKKVWILYPFLYVYKAIRYSVLCLFGKRSSFIKMAPYAAERKSVYDKLGIFETEEEIENAD